MTNARPNLTNNQVHGRRWGTLSFIGISSAAVHTENNSV
jgi:hypothetical protein